MSVDLSWIHASGVRFRNSYQFAAERQYRQVLQKQVLWRIQSIPTSIIIGRVENPASLNAGWIANLADLSRTNRKIRTI